MPFWRKTDCSDTTTGADVTYTTNTTDSTLGSALSGAQNALGQAGQIYAYPSTLPTWITSSMTSTGTSYGPFTGLSTQASAAPIIPNTDSLSLLPDGRVLVTFAFGKCAITKEQLKDIQALLEMGALDKLVGGPEEGFAP